MVLFPVPEGDLRVVCTTVMAQTTQGVWYQLNTTGRDVPAPCFYPDSAQSTYTDAT